MQSVRDAHRLAKSVENDRASIDKSEVPSVRQDLFEGSMYQQRDPAAAVRQKTYVFQPALGQLPSIDQSQARRLGCFHFQKTARAVSCDSLDPPIRGGGRRAVPYVYLVDRILVDLFESGDLMETSRGRCRAGAGAVAKEGEVSTDAADEKDVGRKEADGCR